MKTVVITGSTRGIGKGLASNFLARGCQVVISGRRQEDVDAVVAELGTAHGAERVAGKACEITDAGQLQGLWDAAVTAFGRVDVWINNAGVSIPRENLSDTDPEAIARIVDINLGGLLLANRVALRGMQAQGGGQIWNMEGFGSGTAGYVCLRRYQACRELYQQGLTEGGQGHAGSGLYPESWNCRDGSAHGRLRSGIARVAEE